MTSFSFGRRGSFWTAGAVLALCLWASASPSLLYPLYADTWRLPEVVTALVFAAYPVALLVMLITLGGLSDRIGRKRAILFGVISVTLSAVVMAFAVDVGWLLAGRALQGVGTGLALSAASASVVEHNVSANPRWPSAFITITTSVGIAFALITGGAIAQFAPAPLFTNFVVLFVLALITLLAVLALPADGPAALARTRGSTLPGVPRRLLRVFFASALGVSVAYAVGTIVLSLGADIARAFTGADNFFLIGLIMGSAVLCIVITALFLHRVPSHVSVLVGCGLAVVAVALAVAAAASADFVVLAVWMVVSELVFAFAFTGGLGLITRAAPAEHRAAAIALVYLVSYAFQAGTPLVIGGIATGSDLQTATMTAGVAVVVLAVIGAFVTFADRRGSTREAAAPSGASTT